MSKKLTYYSQKVDGKHTISPSELKRRNDWLEAEKDGCIEHTMRRAVKPKSYKQVKTIFGLLIDSIIEQANDRGIDTSEFIKCLIDDVPSGNGLTADFLYQLFLTVCPVVDDDGKKVTLSGMSTVQSAKFFDECRNLTASKTGIYVADPDPNWNKKNSTERSKNVRP